MDTGPRIRIHIKILQIRNTASYETFNGDTITLPTTDDNRYLLSPSNEQRNNRYFHTRLSNE